MPDPTTQKPGTWPDGSVGAKELKLRWRADKQRPGFIDWETESVPVIPLAPLEQAEEELAEAVTELQGFVYGPPGPCDPELSEAVSAVARVADLLRSMRQEAEGG